MTALLTALFTTALLTALLAALLTSLFNPKVPFPYDLGPARNWRAVMGSGPLACFLSVAPPSDGLAFPVRSSAGRDDGEAGDDAAWPPPLFEEILEAERAKSKNIDVDTGAGVGGSSSSDYKDPHKTV